MKKRIFTLITMFILLCASSSTVFAAKKHTCYPTYNADRMVDIMVEINNLEDDYSQALAYDMVKILKITDEASSGSKYRSIEVELELADGVTITSAKGWVGIGYISLSINDNILKAYMGSTPSSPMTNLLIYAEHTCTTFRDDRTESTCYQEGTLIQTCITCEHVQSSVIEKKPHDFGEWAVEIPETCVSDGEEVRSCLNDGCDGKETRTISKSHNWSEWSVEIPATCYRDGEEVRSCLRENCEEKETKPILKLEEHTWGEWTTKEEATCEEDGLEKRQCSVIGCSAYEERTVNAKLHSWSEWSVETPATCYRDGEEARSCLRENCEEKETKPISKLEEHTWSEWIIQEEATCEEDGLEKRQCFVIGCSVYEERTIKAKLHNWSEWTVETPATCYRDGEEVRSCLNKDCDKKETKPISKLQEHTWGEWTTQQKATCEEDGLEKRQCSVMGCDAFEEKTINAKSHSWNQWVEVVSPTYTNDGLKERLCGRCNKKETNQIDKYIATDIELNYTSIELFKGEPAILSAKCAPIAPFEGDVTWISSDESIVKVNQDGKITAIAIGKAIITAAVSDISISCEIKVVDGKWKKNNIGWWFEDANGSYPYSCWKMIEGEWYYFNTSGYRVTGWQLLGGTWYYMNADGVMLTGWQMIGNTLYYFNGSGAMVTGWQLISGTWYYFHGSGAMASNQWIGDYYLQANGAMATSQWIGNYYVQSNGAYVSTSGWLLVGSNWYYLGAGGVRLTSQWIGDYYIKANGVMATNEWIGNYYVDSSGAYVSRSGWLAVGGNWYYLGAGGVRLTNQWIDGYYYVGPNGVMATNQWIDGIYWVGSDGRWIPNYGNADLYLQQLKNYIINYGSTNSSGNKFISSSLTNGTTTYSFGIVYDIGNNELRFLMTSNDNGSETAITMPVKTISNTILNPKLTLIIGPYGCQAVANINPVTYTGESDVYFSLTSTIGFTESQIQETGNALLQLGFLAWSDLVEETGVTMKQIGFSAYMH